MPHLVRPPLLTETLERRQLLSRNQLLDQLEPANCLHGGGCGCGLKWTGTEPAAQFVELQGARDGALQAPQLTSRPGAFAKLYLDFDGDFTPEWGGLAPGNTPAYDTDGNAASFSLSELADIRAIFDHTAEAFSIFNLDVTTINPGNLNDLQTLRVVFGGNGAWFGGAGGVAFIDAFSNGAPNTVWTFSKNLFSPRDNAIVAVHEAGHGFGLLHQSVYDANGVKLEEYNPGDSQRGPFMGTSWGARRSMWYDGPNSEGALSFQDDIGMIARSANGFGYADDDFADDLLFATDIGSSAGASIRGVINDTSDRDLFAFTHPGGSIGIGVFRARDTYLTSTGMLDAYVQVYDGSGSVVLQGLNTDLDETLRRSSFPAGDYAIEVSSVGGYGSVGGYTLLVAPTADTAPPTATTASLDWERGPAVEFVFNEDVSASLTPSDVSVYSFTANAWVPGPAGVEWVASTNTARFILPVDFPAGDYYFELASRAAADAWFNETPEAYPVWDYLLPGDANRDRAVNFADLLVLAQNYDQSGRTFSQGNFDYSTDGLVSFSDLLIVAQHFNSSLLVSPQPNHTRVRSAAAGREADALLA
jgi:hypothetical protein